MKMLVEAGEPYHLAKVEGYKLEFGGLTVEYDSTGNRFQLTDRMNRTVEVDEADVTDTIKFMLRHFRPCFAGNSILNVKEAK